MANTVKFISPLSPFFSTIFLRFLLCWFCGRDDDNLQKDETNMRGEWFRHFFCLNLRNNMYCELRLLVATFAITNPLTVYKYRNFYLQFSTRWWWHRISFLKELRSKNEKKNYLSVCFILKHLETWLNTGLPENLMRNS